MAGLQQDNLSPLKSLTLVSLHLCPNSDSPKKQLQTVGQFFCKVHQPTLSMHHFSKMVNCICLDQLNVFLSLSPPPPFLWHRLKKQQQEEREMIA